MWPDDLNRRDRENGSIGDDFPGDADLAALDAELTAAGARSRRRSPARGSASFAASLRKRLLASYATADAVAADAADAAAAQALPASAALADAGPAAVTTPREAVVPWPLAGSGSSSSRARGADEPALRELPTGPVAHAPKRLAIQTSLRTPTVLPAPRWSILAIAAALVVAIGGLNASLLFPAPPDTRVGAAVGAELVRAGAVSDLVPGTELLAGDEVRVGPDGFASLQLGDSRIRLAADADVRLVTLEQARIVVDQVAGRAWHRVVLPEGGRYLVTTADVTWTAVGTAFDLDRTGAGAADGDIVHELSVEHAVVVDGPGLRVTVDQGRGATVRLGPSPTVETSDVSPLTAAADPWVRANAAADGADGLPLGMLDGLDLAVATPGPTSNLTPRPTSTPGVTEPPVATAAPTPTPPPTAAPTPKPTPKPTPAPTFGTLALTTLACPGGVVLDWTVPDMAAFNHVQVLRGTSAEIPTTYPPSGGVVAIEGGYSADSAKTDGQDPTVDGASAWYRAVAYDINDKAIAASAAKGVTTPAITDLGTMGVSGTAPGELTFSWTPFTGSADCFTYYKLVASVDDPTPSYLEGSTYLAAISEQAAAGTIVSALPSGSTYWLRLQAIRATSLGKFIVAQTIPVQYTVP